MASTLQRLRRACERIEKRVQYKRLADEDELAEYRPGGSENKEKRGLWPWIRWYGMLLQFLVREEQRDRSLVGGDGETTEEQWRRADEEIVRAMRSAPSRLRLTTPLHDNGGTVEYVSVYPKSFEALVELYDRHCAIAWLTQRHPLLLDTDAAGLELAGRALKEIVFQNQVCAWIICTPGARLPFDDPPVDVPEMWKGIDTADLQRIQQVHIVVNALRLSALDKFVRPRGDDDDERLSWSIFGGVMAERLKRPANELLRDMSLSELVATAATMNVPHQKAAAEADRKLKEAQRATA